MIIFIVCLLVLAVISLSRMDKLRRDEIAELKRKSHNLHERLKLMEVDARRAEMSNACREWEIAELTRKSDNLHEHLREISGR